MSMQQQVGDISDNGDSRNEFASQVNSLFEDLLSQNAHETKETTKGETSKDVQQVCTDVNASVLGKVEIQKLGVIERWKRVNGRLIKNLA